MTTVTNTIGGDGADYATIAAWNTATAVDCVTTTTSYVGVFTGQQDVGSGLTLGGATTNATYNRKLKAAERYQPMWDVGARLDGDGTAVLTVEEDHFKLEGFGLYNTATRDSKYTLYITGNEVIVDSVYAEQTGSNGGTIFNAHSSSRVDWWNCIAVGAGAASGARYGFYGGFEGSTYLHCIAYKLGGTSQGYPANAVILGVGFSVPRSTVKNCIARNCYTKDFDFSASGVVTGSNISSDATATTTNGSQTLVGDLWAHADDRDFRLSGLTGVGDGKTLTEPSTDFTGATHDAAADGREIGPYDCAGTGLGLAINVPSSSSTAAFGLPISASLKYSIRPDGIASTAAVGALTIHWLSLRPDGIASQVGVGSPLLTQHVQPAGITDIAGVGDPTTTQHVQPDGIASTAVVGDPTVIWDQVLLPSSVPDTGGVGTPAANAVYCWEAAYNLIRARFDDNTSVLTEYDNMTIEPPDDALWARFSVETYFADQTMCGDPISYRKLGDVVVSVFAPIDSGDGDALNLVDTVRTLFRDVTVSDVKFQQPIVTQVGRQQRWHRIDVTCPFYVDEVMDVAPTVNAIDPNQSHDTEYTHNSIRARFKSQVEDAEDVVVLYDNVHIDHPDDDRWVLLTILDGSSERSGSVYRTTGVIDAAVFVPIDAGDQSALALADRIVRAFMPSTFDGVKYRVPYVTPVGRSGKWWQLTITCPYQVDELIT